MDVFYKSPVLKPLTESVGSILTMVNESEILSNHRNLIENLTSEARGLDFPRPARDKFRVKQKKADIITDSNYRLKRQ